MFFFLLFFPCRICSNESVANPVFRYAFRRQTRLTETPKFWAKILDFFLCEKYFRPNNLLQKNQNIDKTNLYAKILRQI